MQTYSLHIRGGSPIAVTAPHELRGGDLVVYLSTTYRITAVNGTNIFASSEGTPVCEQYPALTETSQMAAAA